MNLAPTIDPRPSTRHLPELPLPTVEDVAADWGLGWHLAQALRQVQNDMIKTAWGTLMTTRCKLGPQATAGAERAPAEIITGGRQRRQISAEHVSEGWRVPRDLRAVIGHIERVSKAKSALGAVEALDDALASLGNAITARDIAPAPCAHECDCTTGAEAPPRPERAPASVRSKP